MGRDQAQDIRRFGWANAASAKLVALAARVSANPSERGDPALQRLVMVLMAVGTLPLTVLWAAVYLVAGVAARRRSASGLFGRDADQHGAVRLDPQPSPLPFHPLLMTLVLPWLVTLSLGGFKNSSAVIIWAALCPVVSLLVEDLRQTLLWIVGFVVLLIVSARL